MAGVPRRNNVVGAKGYVNDTIESMKKPLADLSDRIWEFAETRYEEKKSSEALCLALEAEGFKVERNAGAVPYAFIGTFGSGKPVIGFLGEYDALFGISQKDGSATREPLIPGANGHGCYHHALGVGSLGAAFAFKRYIQEKGINCTVKYFGCPGEEGGSGKAFMARAHLFDDLDAAITWHSSSTTRVSLGSSLANIQVYYRFTGKAAHAAAHPHLGRSALDAVELMNVGVNYMREHVISDARVHYALINTGGKSPNVVQPEAEVLYLIRAPKNDQVKEIYAWVCEIARGAAMMTQTKVDIQIDKACSNLVPNLVLAKLMQANIEAVEVPKPSAADVSFAKEIRATLNASEKNSVFAELTEAYGERTARELKDRLSGDIYAEPLPLCMNEKAFPGSTDVGDVSWVVPTVQCNTSCMALGTPGHSWQQVAQGKSDWAHKGTLMAAKVMAQTAIDLLEQPEKIAEAKAELKERLAGGAYVCPIPADVKPAPVK
jgi:aminobenzoyl-glutamate utilization protein B